MVVLNLVLGRIAVSDEFSGHWLAFLSHKYVKLDILWKMTTSCLYQLVQIGESSVKYQRYLYRNCSNKQLK